MEEEELRELFCAKINLEIKRFKQDVLWKDNETVYANAFQIDGMIRIYELLLEISQEKGEKTLKKLLVFPSLLTFLATHGRFPYRGTAKMYRAVHMRNGPEIQGG